jgi:3-phosphoshikimate 1-carboxyvinyltransferase
MKRPIEPCRHPLRATVHVPGSKSITNRALICAALAQGESVLRGASDSDDTALMCNGLNQLGVLVRRTDDCLIVSGTGGRLYAPKFPIPVGNAGTTFRFLLSLAALAHGTTLFEADPRMAERPVTELLDALASLGVRVEANGYGRYGVHGGTLSGGSVHLSGSKSSQFLSSLLMVAPWATSRLSIEVEGPLASAPYVALTLQVMEHFGVKVERYAEKRFVVHSGQRYAPAEFAVEPDASSAGYFFAAAALCGGEVSVQGLTLRSLQADAQFVELLQRMGCLVREDANAVCVSGDGSLRGIEADMNAMPDAVPTLAVLAPFATTPTRISNVAHLRHKESDRLAALATELRKLGAHIDVKDDGLEIHPSSLAGGVVDTYNDHRLAMSFALVGLKVPGIEIANPACVRKSFPGYWKEFDKLYGDTRG